MKCFRWKFAVDHGTHVDEMAVDVLIFRNGRFDAACAAYELERGGFMDLPIGRRLTIAVRLRAVPVSKAAAAVATKPTTWAAAYSAEPCAN